MRITPPFLAVMLLITGCVSNVRNLTNGELKAMQKVHHRLKGNSHFINKSLTQLEGVGEDALLVQNSVDVNIAKAKLLESMRSPWIQQNPKSAQAITQQEAALYHLYALTQADREVMDARLAERAAALARVRTTYSNLVIITKRVIKNEELVLAHLNQPPSAFLVQSGDAVLSEIKALRKQLAKSDNPELKQLAEKADKAEDRLTKVRDGLEKFLDSYAKIKQD